MKQELTVDIILDLLSELEICDIRTNDAKDHWSSSSTICQYCFNRSEKQPDGTDWCSTHCDCSEGANTYKECWRRYFELRLEEKRRENSA